MPQDACAGPYAFLRPDRPHGMLAFELFEEQDWAACRTESQRILLTTPDEPNAMLLNCLAELRLGIDSSARLRRLAEAPATPRPIAMVAHYELGRAAWARDATRQALLNLSRVFAKTELQPLFLRSGCTLSLLLRQEPKLAAERPALKLQLRSCARLWSGTLRRECAVHRPRRRLRLFARIGRGLITFYRSQIGPAIGERCVLEPSCSEYCRQAFAKHGWLAFAIQGDRFVREPDVVAEKKNPIQKRGRTRYPDPLEDHDWWLK